MKDKVFDEFKEKLDQIVSDQRYANEGDARELVKMLGLEPPEQSPFPKVSPGPWCTDGEIGTRCDGVEIFGDDHIRIGRLTSVNMEANKSLIIAAPLLMRALYAIEVIWQANGERTIWEALRDSARDALKLAGVKLDPKR